jgi:hypothetical protein
MSITSGYGCYEYGRYDTFINGQPVVDGNIAEAKVYLLTKIQNLFVFLKDAEIFNFIKLVINNIGYYLNIPFKFVT